MLNYEVLSWKNYKCLIFFFRMINRTFLDWNTSPSFFFFRKQFFRKFVVELYIDIDIDIDINRNIVIKKAEKGSCVVI